MENGVLLCDEVNDFSVRVPEDWTTFGTTIVNYSEEDVAALGQGQEGVFPPGGLKINIYAGPITAGTFEAFVAETIEQNRQPYGPGTTPLIITEPEPYELAGYQGVTYTVEPEGQNHVPTQVISLLAQPEKVFHIGIMPAASPALDEGLAILATLQDGECTE